MKFIIFARLKDSNWEYTRLMVGDDSSCCYSYKDNCEVLDEISTYSVGFEFGDDNLGNALKSLNEKGFEPLDELLEKKIIDENTRDNIMRGQINDLVESMKKTAKLTKVRVNIEEFARNVSKIFYGNVIDALHK